MASRAQVHHPELLQHHLKLYKKFPGKKYFVPLAEIYRASDNLEEAAALLEEGLKKHPGYFIARSLLAQTYYQMTRFVQAAMEADKVLEKAADNLLALRVGARAYWKLGQLNKSKTILEHLLALIPGDADALNLRAMIFKPHTLPTAAQRSPETLSRIEDFRR